jgi:hypothetical protein
MEEVLRTGLGISDAERRQIIDAMGMQQGHWYKCPNGHIYVITDCGGAMEESKCNECGALIGMSIKKSSKYLFESKSSRTHWNHSLFFFQVEEVTSSAEIMR